jgi:hypothetical protein
MANCDIGLARLYRNLKAATPLLVTPSQACGITLDKPTKCRVTIRAAHLFHLFALDISRLQPQMEMFAENTLDFLEFPPLG